MKMNNKVWLVMLLALLLGASCANVVAPDGGEIDTTPPVLLSIDPADSQLNIKPKNITARFNKYMEVKDLAANMTITPLIDIQPSVMAFGKRVEIKLVDSLLRPNTTYKISFGKALTDNREYTPVSDFSYIFSTGSFFDSLRLEGYVIDALTGLPDTGVSVFLYDAEITDSAIAFKKPIYVVKTNLQGKFHFDLLPALDFKLLAVKDIDNNMLYTAGAERMAYWDVLVNPAQSGELSSYMYSFMEDDTTGAAKRAADAANASSKRKMGMGRTNDAKNKKAELTYLVLADTTNKESRTFDVNKPLAIQLMQPTTIDKDKIYLSYNASGIDVEAVLDIQQGEDSLILQTEWQEDKEYTLRLIKGWARDTAQNELVPGRYFFKTKSKQDYGELKINFADSFVNTDFIALVKTEKDTIFYGPVVKMLALKYLQPETYTVFIFKDIDGNGKWSTGDFIEKEKPELMIPHDGKILLRAGWENEVDFKPYFYNTGSTQKPKLGVEEKP